MLDHVHHLIIIVSCLTSLFFWALPLFCRPRWEKGRHQLPRLAWNPERWQKTPHPWSHESSVATWAMTAMPLHQQQWHREDGTNWYRLSLNSSSAEECQGETTTINHDQPRNTKAAKVPEIPPDSRWNPVESGGPCRNFLSEIQGIPRCWFQTTGIHLPEKDQSQLPGSSNCTAVD